MYSQLWLPGIRRPHPTRNRVARGADKCTRRPVVDRRLRAYQTNTTIHTYTHAQHQQQKKRFNACSMIGDIIFTADLVRDVRRANSTLSENPHQFGGVSVTPNLSPFNRIQRRPMAPHPAHPQTHAQQCTNTLVPVVVGVPKALGE